ncbi:MAG: hypothetical protein K0U78_20150 [Actinomycetia bacterium]|nr:hypothetical protein [Actinomycetes bacterium]
MVDPVANAAEIARFFSRVVVGPGRQDCWLWCAAVGSDGYGRFRIHRDGQVKMVRPPRYALAVARAGRALEADTKALHECDLTLCVRVVAAAEFADGVRPHVVPGTQRENMERMAARGRGGGRPAVIARGAGEQLRRQRAVELRAAVRGGWNPAAVQAALLGQQPRLW